MKITFLIGLPESGKSTIGRPLAVNTKQFYGETSSIIKEKLAQIIAGSLMTVYTQALATLAKSAGINIEGMNAKQITDVAQRAGVVGQHYWNNALDIATASARNQVNGAIALERSGNRAVQPMRQVLVALGDSMRREYGTYVLSRTIIERAAKDGFAECIVSGVRDPEELSAAQRWAYSQGYKTKVAWVNRPNHQRSAGSEDNTLVKAHHADVIILAAETTQETELGVAPTDSFPDPVGRSKAIMYAIWNSDGSYQDDYYTVRQLRSEVDQEEETSENTK